jgi:hypothetical protein
MGTATEDTQKALNNAFEQKVMAYHKSLQKDVRFEAVCNIF